MPEPTATKKEALKIIDGVVIDKQVKVALCPLLDKGPMPVVRGIVMHQTNGDTVAGTLSQYRTVSPHQDGAHILIDKDGTIYQTMQINHKCQHVGPIKSRCLAEVTCSKEETALQAAIQKQPLKATQKYGQEAAHEWTKPYPTRYPYNADAIGIEVVGKAVGPLHHEVYPNPTPQQNASVHWLVPALLDALKLTVNDVYRHPMLSRKNETEAQGVTW